MCKVKYLIKEVEKGRKTEEIIDEAISVPNVPLYKKDAEKTSANEQITLMDINVELHQLFKNHNKAFLEIGRTLDHLENKFNIPRNILKQAFLAIRNQGQLRLISGIDEEKFQEKDIIKEEPDFYFAYSLYEDE